MDENIRKRISQYNPVFDISTQKAELLFRNQQFQIELQAVLSWTTVTDLERAAGVPVFDSQEDREESSIRAHLEFRRNVLGEHILQRNPDRTISAKNYGEVEVSDYFEELVMDLTRFFKKKLDQAHRDSILKMERVWEKFCKNWNIRPEWDGNRETLSAFLKQPVELIFVKGKKGQTPELMLRITEWTTLNDIKQVWKRVEKYQKEMIKKWEKRTRFTRDLCWYDLAKEHQQKPRQIAENWIEAHPEDIDLLVTRRMKKKIKKQDLQGKSLDDAQMLLEIKSGFLKEIYEAAFDEERDFYISGETGTERGIIRPPFIDVIKNAIKRMEDQIALFESYPGNVIDIAQIISAGLTMQDRFNPST